VVDVQVVPVGDAGGIRAIGLRRITRTPRRAPVDLDAHLPRLPLVELYALPHVPPVQPVLELGVGRVVGGRIANDAAGHVVRPGRGVDSSDIGVVPPVTRVGEEHDPLPVVVGERALVELLHEELLLTVVEPGVAGELVPGLALALVFADRGLVDREREVAGAAGRQVAHRVVVPAVSDDGRRDPHVALEDRGQVHQTAERRVEVGECGRVVDPAAVVELAVQDLGGVGVDEATVVVAVPDLVGLHQLDGAEGRGEERRGPVPIPVTVLGPLEVGELRQRRDRREQDEEEANFAHRGGSLCMFVPLRTSSP